MKSCWRKSCQLAALKKQRELDEEKREMDLTIEKRTQEGQEQIRLKAQSQADEKYQSKLNENDIAMISMRKQIEILKRKSEQGSQQLQGEAQEIELEGMLMNKFPLDLIKPVAKGEFGGDVMHYVNNSNNQKR